MSDKSVCWDGCIFREIECNQDSTSPIQPLKVPDARFTKWNFLLYRVSYCQSFCRDNLRPNRVPSSQCNGVMRFLPLRCKQGCECWWVLWWVNGLAGEWCSTSHGRSAEVFLPTHPHDRCIKLHCINSVSHSCSPVDHLVKLAYTIRNLWPNCLGQSGLQVMLIPSISSLLFGRIMDQWDSQYVKSPPRGKHTSRSSAWLARSNSMEHHV